MKLGPLTPLTPAPGQDNAPVCVDGVCEIPSTPSETPDAGNVPVQAEED